MVKISTVSVLKETHTKLVRAGNGRLKTTEPTVHGRTEDIGDASQVPFPSVGQSRREKLPSANSEKNKQMRSGPVMVPVLSSLNKPLMPCHSARARELIKQGRAVRRWYKGIFAIKMLDRAVGDIQQIVCGIDPGSKREAFTIMSKNHTYLNILSDAVTHVQERIKNKREMRRARRFRKTPCRISRWNYHRNKIWFPPSIKSRWLIKLNIVKFINKLYPISDICIEDIKAKNFKSKRNWNNNFSPLETGKKWFYEECKKLGVVHLKQGWETFKLRNVFGLKKSKNKMKEIFESHNVDSWVMARSIVNGQLLYPCNKKIFRISSIQWHRRQLHYTNPGKNGKRSLFGGTFSLGLKRGSLVIHPKYGIAYLGGSSFPNRITLHNLKNGIRLTQRGSIKDLKFLCLNNWKTHWIKE